jgi:hypothetical protein
LRRIFRGRVPRRVGYGGGMPMHAPDATTLTPDAIEATLRRGEDPDGVDRILGAIEADRVTAAPSLTSQRLDAVAHAATPMTATLIRRLTTMDVSTVAAILARGPRAFLDPAARQALVEPLLDDIRQYWPDGPLSPHVWAALTVVQAWPAEVPHYTGAEFARIEFEVQSAYQLMQQTATAVDMARTFAALQMTRPLARAVTDTRSVRPEPVDRTYAVGVLRFEAGLLASVPDVFHDPTCRARLARFADHCPTIAARLLVRNSAGPSFALAFAALAAQSPALAADVWLAASTDQRAAVPRDRVVPLLTLANAAVRQAVIFTLSGEMAPPTDPLSEPSTTSYRR